MSHLHEPDSMPQSLTKGLREVGYDPLEIKFYRGDCSPRKYYKFPGGKKLLMTDPCASNLDKFVRVSQILALLGFRVAHIFEINFDKGFLVIENLGDATFTHEINQGAPLEELYMLAMDVLIELHKKTVSVFEGRDQFSAYTKDVYFEELSLFLDWYVPFLERPSLSLKKKREFYAAFESAFSFASSDHESVLIHRDFHVDNMIYLKEEEGIKKCALLDYQDALMGPRMYDIVSLLEDARMDIPEKLVTKCLHRYFSAFPHLNPGAGMRNYFVYGVQRSIRILGVFTRMAAQGREDYLKHLPRVRRYIKNGLKQPYFSDLRNWFEENIFLEEETSGH